MRVLCIKGEEGILEEGSVYNVIEVTNKGNYILLEVEPPQPFTSFQYDRFMPIQDLSLEELEEFQNTGGDRY